MSSSVPWFATQSEQLINTYIYENRRLRLFYLAYSSINNYLDNKLFLHTPTIIQYKMAYLFYVLIKLKTIKLLWYTMEH
jgi:hypothetical protein